MKKYIVLFFAILVTFSSCEDFLDIEPRDEINSASALETAENMQTAIIGCYDRMQSGYLYGGRLWVAGDMIANNVKISGLQNTVFEELQMLNKTMSADNLISSVIWQDAYWIIAQANRIIEAVPVILDPDNDQYKQLMGEAMFIRGIMHYELLRYFESPEKDLGIVLIMSVPGIDDQPTRASIEATYQAIITDLQTASELLPVSNSNRATKYSALGMLARVQFYHGDYADCEIACTQIIDANKFTLEPNIKNCFGESISNEVLFYILSNATDGSAGTLNGYYRVESSAKFRVDGNYFGTINSEQGDNRVAALYDIDVESNKIYTTKFDERFMHIPLLRYSEILLTRAECRVNLYGNNDAGAMEDYNVVRNRAGLADGTLVNLIKLYIERTKELAFEGDNFHNKKRLRVPDGPISALTNIGGYRWDDSEIYCKLPQRELDVNSSLVQN